MNDHDDVDNVTPLRFWNPRDDAWRDHAACLGLDPDLFFPAHGDNATMRQAKAVCATCTVRQPCLDDGINEKFGIRGGLSEKQRRKLRRDLHRSDDDVADVALAAVANGEPATRAVAEHYGLTLGAARSALTRARLAGHDIPAGRPGPRTKQTTAVEPAACGTVAGYNQHHRNGDDTPCQQCRDAYAEWRRGRRATLQVVAS